MRMIRIEIKGVGACEKMGAHVIGRVERVEEKAGHQRWHWNKSKEGEAITHAGSL